MAAGWVKRAAVPGPSPQPSWPGIPATTDTLPAVSDAPYAVRVEAARMSSVWPW